MENKHEMDWPNYYLGEIFAIYLTPWSSSIFFGSSCDRFSRLGVYNEVIQMHWSAHSGAYTLHCATLLPLDLPTGFETGFALLRWLPLWTIFWCDMLEFMKDSRSPLYNYCKRITILKYYDFYSFVKMC